MKGRAGHGESDHRAKSTAELFAPHSRTATRSSLRGRYLPDVSAARAGGVTRLDDDARYVPQPTLRPQNCRGADEDAIAARSGHSAKSSIAETKPSRPADAVASMSSGPGEHVGRLKVSGKRGRPTWSPDQMPRPHAPSHARPMIEPVDDPTSSALGVRSSFFGWRVVAAAFVVAVFGCGVGFFGPSVFLNVLHERRGWPSRRSRWRLPRISRSARQLSPACPISLAKV